MKKATEFLNDYKNEKVLYFEFEVNSDLTSELTNILSNKLNIAIESLNDAINTDSDSIYTELKKLTAINDAKNELYALVKTYRAKLKITITNF